MKKKLLVFLILAVSCLAAGYVASLTMYVDTISNFQPVKTGVIAGTGYSFFVGGESTYYLTNSLSHKDAKLSEHEAYPLQYSVLRHRGGVYLILKRLVATA